MFLSTTSNRKGAKTLKITNVAPSIGGHDIVDIPVGVPLRTWTRSKGQTDKEGLAGLGRNWTTSEDETFKAHLIGFRGFGIDTPDPRFDKGRFKLAPALFCA